MRWPPSRPLMCGTVAALGVASAITGCASNAEKTWPASVTAPSTAAVGATAAPSGVSISPAGVTTNIDVPAYSTEEQYFQACYAAKAWMGDHPGDRQTQVERYLAAVQTPGAVGAGTWNTAWAALPLARQAGVIVAAKAAANDECG